MTGKKAAAVQPGDATYSVDELRSAKADGELQIEFSRKEEYLSDADFAEVFGMSKEDFAGKQAWKKAQLKRTLGLF